ncbi:MAG: glutaminyl-peptide cyclotransferase [Candidatus Acidiferrum sp.]
MTCFGPNNRMWSQWFMGQRVRLLFAATGSVGLWLSCCGAALTGAAKPIATRQGSVALSDKPIPVLSVTVVKTFPHDPKAFTQGLEYYDGFLYESTGLQGNSSLRKVAIDTGKVLRSVLLSTRYFGEGLTIFHGKIYQLTWLSKTGFIYGLLSFRKTGEFHYESEGWGLTHDDQSLILSDGSNQLQFIDPATFQVQRRLEVYAGREAVANLNELEYINGQIYANVWHSTRIARIDPRTGQVLAWLDLQKISAEEQHGPEEVLNGIAYDRAGQRLFVTGKDWPNLFQIKIEEK